MYRNLNHKLVFKKQGTGAAKQRLSTLRAKLQGQCRMAPQIQIKEEDFGSLERCFVDKIKLLSRFFCSGLDSVDRNYLKMFWFRRQILGMFCSPGRWIIIMEPLGKRKGSALKICIPSLGNSSCNERRNKGNKALEKQVLILKILVVFIFQDFLFSRVGDLIHRYHNTKSS